VTASDILDAEDGNVDFPATIISIHRCNARPARCEDGFHVDASVSWTRRARLCDMGNGP